jgi:hypothetical protein
MANTYLTRTVGTPTNIDKYTFSVWVKRADIGAANSKIFSVANGAFGEEKLEFNQDDLIWRQTLPSDGNIVWQRVTDRKFRDSSAWYHIVVAYDSLQGTAGDRCKMYINGVQETSFSGSADPSSGTNSYTNTSGSTLYIGRLHSASSQFFGGSMSHMHYIDGTAYDATAFGEYDANGVWTIKTSPSVTYGTNGFFILKNGNSVTDQSGNSNNFTVAGGTLTKTEDSPSNVFATLNPLNANIGATIPTLSMGNNRTSNSIINKMQTQYSTIAPSTGKFYCEVKATAGSVFRIGISSYNSNQAQGSSDTQNRPGQFSEGWGYDKTGTVYKNESSVGSYTAYNTGDIICIALDMTNKKLYFKRDANAWENSANPATGSNGIDISSIPSGTGMAFGAGLESGSVGAAYADFNFGNGYFGTTAVSSAGTNASGIGIFEFDVPSGYTALSTKGLNL